MPGDNLRELEAALASLGSFESLVITRSRRTIVAACMEVGAFYAINLWCEVAELADNIETFLKGRGIVGYRTPANDRGRVSVGYAVNNVIDAALTVKEVAQILELPLRPQHGGKLIQFRQE